METSSIPIREIPLEILLRISHHLSTPDLGNLRLTCRGIEQALFKSFTDEFFTRKQFMISYFSLETLVDIAKSRLGCYLRHVYIGLDHLVPSHAFLRVAEERQRRFQDFYALQLDLWTTGALNPLLAEAFRNLQNLESVVVRDFNSHKRSRDGRNAQWNSYGAPTMLNECGMQPSANSESSWNRVSGLNPNYGSQVFKAVIHALGTAGARPAAVEVMERKGNRMQDSAFLIAPSAEPYTLPVLHGLKRLHLCIDVTWTSHMINDQSRAFNNYLLRKFLAHCHSLEDLRINDQRSSIRDPGCTNLPRLFHWLAAPVPSGVPSSSEPGPDWWDSQPPPVAFPHLEALSLGMMTMTADDILAVIRKFAPSLTRLELWKITLIPHQRTADDEILDNKIILWTRFFKRLRDIPGLNLRHIKVGMLQQHIPSIHGRPLTMNVGFTGDGLINLREYTGPDCGHFVNQEIIARLNIEWKKYIINEEDGEGNGLYQLMIQVDDPINNGQDEVDSEADEADSPLDN